MTKSSEYDLAIIDGQGKVKARQKGQGECRLESLGERVNLELVKIPGGRFLMGSPASEGYDSERPQHPVSVESFWMGKCPVTQAQWKVVAGFPKVERELDPDPSYRKGDNRPIESVSWYEANEFCQRLTQKTGQEYRLPSEAEWEYACRAGTTTPFYAEPTLTTNLANYEFHYKSTSEVGRFSTANAFGLYDMHGNVWEWCMDPVHGSYQDAPADGSAWVNGGDKSLRLLRGGSWVSNSDSCRSAYRYWGNPVSGDVHIGLRVVSVSVRTLG